MKLRGGMIQHSINFEAALGIIVLPLDVGLALCVRGMGKGPVTRCFLGLRTRQNGVPVLLITKLRSQAALALFAGVTPSAWTVSAILSLDKALTLTHALQIASGPPIVRGASRHYDAVSACRFRTVKKSS